MCMGRTVVRYWLTADSTVLPLSRMSGPRRRMKRKPASGTISGDRMEIMRSAIVILPDPVSPQIPMTDRFATIVYREYCRHFFVGEPTSREPVRSFTKKT